MRTEEGEIHTVGGQYKEISPRERLVYTWRWEEGPESVMAGSEDTVVAIDFLEDGDGTLVKQTHTGLASDEIKGMHAHGWESVLANLESNVFS